MQLREVGVVGACLGYPYSSSNDLSHPQNLNPLPALLPLSLGLVLSLLLSKPRFVHLLSGD